MYRVHTFAVTVYTRSNVAVTFKTNDVYADDYADLFDLSVSSDLCDYRGSNIRFENPNSDPIHVLKFEIYSISAFDLALHYIIISANSLWIFFILFANRFLSRNIVGTRL